MSNHPQMGRFPLEDKRQKLTAEIQKIHPEMSHAAALERANAQLECDTRKLVSAFTRKSEQKQVGATGNSHRSASTDPAQSGIVKRAEAMAAAAEAAKAAENAGYARNLIGS